VHTGNGALIVETSDGHMARQCLWPMLGSPFVAYLLLDALDAYFNAALTGREALTFLMLVVTIAGLVFISFSRKYKTALRLLPNGELRVEFVYSFKTLRYFGQTADIVEVAAVGSLHSEAENLYVLRVQLAKGLPLAIGLSGMADAVRISGDVCSFLNGQLQPLRIEFTSGVTRGQDPIKVYKPRKWLQSMA
jgi:hypothetical protein